jgi:phenylacetate-CoA ligase
VVPSTPFYRDRPGTPELARSGKLEDLPLLSKAEVRSNRNAFLNAAEAGRPQRVVHTSGTTGQALVFPVSQRCFQREYAFRELHYRWGGVSQVSRDRFAFCAGHPVAPPAQTRPPFWTHDRANGHLYFSSYHLAAANLGAYVRELERFDPVLLAGYPSSLYVLALAHLRLGRGRVRPRCVYTFSETLLSFQRSAIEQSFGCKVFNWYGNTEMSANIVECEKGELHLKYEHSFVEVLDDDNRPCGPGQTGRLVCTAFGNPAFPLIRYDIGDTVRLSGRAQSLCGRGGLLVDEVLGRAEDYILTPDGRLAGRLDHLFKDSINVLEAQIVQTTVEEVVLRIARGADFSERDEQSILAEARVRLGPAVRIRFDYVERIPRSVGGKFRFIVSTLNQEEALSRIGG